MLVESVVHLAMRHMTWLCLWVGGSWMSFRHSLTGQIIHGKGHHLLNVQNVEKYQHLLMLLTMKKTTMLTCCSCFLWSRFGIVGSSKSWNFLWQMIFLLKLESLKKRMCSVFMRDFMSYCWNEGWRGELEMECVGKFEIGLK